MPLKEKSAPSVATREVVIPQCEHIRLSGQRCGSPALRGENHCYFHDYTFNPRYRFHGSIPLPEDAASIQVGITRVIRMLEALPESPRNCALMLYALQTASSNLKRVREEVTALAVEAEEQEQAGEANPLIELLRRELEAPPEGCVE
jgi:hypothetical protein